MIDRLPYQLSTLAVAHYATLEITDWAFSDWLNTHPEGLGERYYSWDDARRLLKYREGEPWCHDTARGILCVPGDETNDTWIGLHRLAAILCDDAEGFRVLQWCVHNLGGQR